MKFSKRVGQFDSFHQKSKFFIWLLLYILYSWSLRFQDSELKYSFCCCSFALHATFGWYSKRHFRLVVLHWSAGHSFNLSSNGDAILSDFPQVTVLRRLFCIDIVMSDWWSPGYVDQEGHRPFLMKRCNGVGRFFCAVWPCWKIGNISAS